MLILNRKREERVVIETEAGERVEVTVCQISQGKVRLGFEAPRGVTIMRSEIENDRAASA